MDNFRYSLIDVLYRNGKINTETYKQIKKHVGRKR